MDARSPLVTLNNGVRMPALGLGVFQSAPEETVEVIHAAFAAGYRLIDTAAAYKNERQVGEAVRTSGLPREAVFVTTKLWMTDYGYDEALRAFDISVRKLGLDYLDLYLLHWPTPTAFDKTIASYRAAERLLAEGRVRAIGVSNFTAAHLGRLMESATVVPALNQLEAHPFFSQRAEIEANRRLGVVVQAWSPIGGAYNRNPAASPAAARSPLEHPTVLELAARHGKTPAQVVLRWHIERQTSAIPKSVRPERIAENIDLFDFSLTPQECEAVEALDCGARAGADPEVVTATTFPHRIDDA